MPEEIAFLQSKISTSIPDGSPPRLDTLTSCQPDELRSALERVYISFYRDPDDLARYLAPNCLQHLSTRTLNYPQIVEHVRQIRSSAMKIRYSVVQAIIQGDTIADRHVVELTSQDQRTVTLEAFCFLRLAEGKVVEIREAVQTLGGDPKLGAMASASD